MGSFTKKLLSLLILCTISGVSFANDLTDDYFDIAQNYYAEGAYDKALDYVNQILGIEPNNLDAIGLKIKLLPPNSTKPIIDIDRPLVFDVPYIKSANQTADLYYEQGLTQYKNKQYALAEESLDIAIQMGQNNFRAYNTQGLIYWAQDKIPSAISAFEKSNELNKEFTLSLDNLSQIYRQKNDFKKCKETLDLAISQNSYDFCAYLLLGDYYRDLCDYDKALKSYREVIKINPKYNNAYLKIAKTKIESCDFEGAISTLNYYHKLNNNEDIVYFLIAKSYEYLNNYDKAKENIFKAILMNNCVTYRIELAKIYYSSDDVQNALESLKSIPVSKMTPEAYNYLGMCYYLLHDFNKAIINITKAIELQNSRILYYYNLAQVYETLKDTQNYNKYISIIKSKKLENFQDYIDMSGILLNLEGKNASIDILNKGISEFPNQKELYLEKLKIYELTEDTDGMDRTKIEIERVFK